MNNFNLSEDKQRALLEMAGKKFGKSPEELKAQLESGQLDSLLGNIDTQKKDQINSLLQNPKALEAMLQNEQVKKLLGGLLGGQK